MSSYGKSMMVQVKEIFENTKVDWHGLLTIKSMV